MSILVTGLSPEPLIVPVTNKIMGLVLLLPNSLILGKSFNFSGFEFPYVLFVRLFYTKL